MAKTKQKQKAKQEVSESQLCREKAAEAYSKVETGYLDLAEVLFSIKHNEYYRDYGAATFNDYCDHELGLKPGKANSLTQIWDGIKGLNLDRDRLEAIGWSKVRLLVGVATEDNIEDLLEFAETRNATRLEEYVQTLRGSTPRASGLVLKFQAGSTNAKVMMEAIEMALKVFDTEDPTVACANIVMQWMTDAGILPEKLPLETFIALLERTYGGKLIYQEDEDSLDPEFEDDDEDSEEDEEDSEEDSENEEDDFDEED